MAAATVVSKKHMLAQAARKNNKRPLNVGSNKETLTNADNLEEDDDIQIRTLTKEEFEESINLVTNNKINNLNTWNLPLIEYFHDMNHLKSDDGKSINFQKASTTLDGCVKIMSKRIDSVAIDTNTLLQILSLNNDDGKSKSRKLNDDSDDENDEEDDDYVDEKTQRKRLAAAAKKNGDAKTTTTFERIRVNDHQLQCVTIDPVFRKMLAEFDEGGAKSLLLNTLRISQDGKVMLDDAVSATHAVFDSDDYTNSKNNFSNDAEISIVKPDEDEIEAPFWKQEEEELNNNVNLSKKDLNKDEHVTITSVLIDSFKGIITDPQFKNFQICDEIVDLKASLNDFEYSKEFIAKMNEKIESDNKIHGDDEPLPEFHVEYDYDIDNFDLNKGVDPNNNTNNGYLSENSQFDDMGPEYNDYPINDNEINDDQSMYNDEEITRKEIQLMAELDKRLNLPKSHWKIRAINSKSGVMSTNIESILSTDTEQNIGKSTKDTNNSKSKKGRNSEKKRNEYTIDFMSDSPDTDISILFKKSSKSLKLNNPDKVNVEVTTLPDLKVWNSERLVTSLLKPKRRFKNIFSRRSTTSKAALYADREFWALKYNDNDVLKEQDVDEDVADFLYDVMDKKDEENRTNELEGSEQPDYGIDQDPGVYDFDAPMENEPTVPRTEIITARKSAWHKDNIHYEKRSKKINVRLLKKNLWDVTKEQVSHIPYSNHNDIKLSDIVKQTYVKYEGREKSDLSTSFFFICMLHIANEEGLSIDKTDDLSDLIIHTH
jgi:condensin complex subunit 2